MTRVPCLRQAVLAARDLEATVARLQAELGLGEPYRDPAVAHFGLANAVFALGETFLEVVSPIGIAEPGARTAARRLQRADAAVCGHMVMLQVEDLSAARERARRAGVREVFCVELEDIAEVHLHPADIRGAIVSLTEPRPPDSWRWGGEGWRARSVPGRLSAVTLALAEPAAAAAHWSDVAGGELPDCRFERDEREPGLVEIELRIGERRRVLRPGGL
jgi:hypothetical protein